MTHRPRSSFQFNHRPKQAFVPKFEDLPSEDAAKPPPPLRYQAFTPKFEHLPGEATAAATKTTSTSAASVSKPVHSFFDKRKRESSQQSKNEPEMLKSEEELREERIRRSAEARDELFKQKAKNKREFEKNEKLQRELRGYARLDSSFLQSSTRRSGIIADDEFMRPPLSIDDDDDDDVQIVTSSIKPIRVPPPPKRETVIVKHVSTSPASRPRARVVDESGQPMEEPTQLDWPEREALMKLLAPMAVGCCCRIECNDESHSHELDTTALGIKRLQYLSRNEDARRVDEYRCEMPDDPFDEEKFELFSFLANTLDGANGAETSPTHTQRMTTAATSSVDARYLQLMMILHRKYFAELANFRASYSDACNEIDKRHETNLLIARVNGDSDYRSEIEHARQRERETQRNIFHARLDTLESSMKTVVGRTIVQCADTTQFRLPFAMTARACLDVIRLKGGAARSDDTLRTLFAKVSMGVLDNLEAEKKNMPREEALENDMYHEEFRKHSAPNGWHHETPPQQQQQPPSAQQAFTAFGHDEEDENSKKRKTREEAESNGVADTSNRIAYPCKSQFAADGPGNTACTAIAFAMAMRMVSVQFLPVAEELGIEECIFNQIDHNGVLSNGVDIWKKWCDKRREQREKLDLEMLRLFEEAQMAESEPVKVKFQMEFVKTSTARKNLLSDYMLAPEVFESSDYVKKKFDTLNLTSYEVSGFWNDRTPDIDAHDAPALETALEDAAAKFGLFAAVLTIGSSSIAVAFNDARWFVFDSHGIDRVGFSSLVRFFELDSLMALVHHTFEEADESAANNELMRMKLNTYSLYVMHFK